MHLLKSDPARAPQDPSISILLVIASALIGLAFVVPGLCRQASGNSTPSNIRVNRLEQQVEVLRDRWGMNHIYARNEHDLFFMQGYCAARDRLFQMELWRRQATGTAAEVFGRKELKRDIAARLFTFRGDVDADLSWYHPHGALIVSAFVDGINTYIDHVLNNPEELPIEFTLLGIRPVHWTSAVVIARNAGVFGSIYVQLNTAIAVHVMGAEKVKRLSSNFTMPFVNRCALRRSRSRSNIDRLREPYRRVHETIGQRNRAMPILPLKESGVTTG